jgi:predicted nucleotidyltransferase
MDDGLPQDVSQGIDAFVTGAKEALGDDLVSVVLFGSAAEGRMRATSDVNLILVLARFTPERVDKLREAFRLAHATIRLEAMMILEEEIAAATEAFAVKFADIRARHKVLHGRDVIGAIHPSRGAMVHRVRQILLNFILRTRERYVLVSLREEQLSPLVADAAGALRAAAEILLELEGRPAASPKEALEKLAAEIDAGAYRDALARMSEAREQGKLPPGVGSGVVLKLLELGKALHQRSTKLSA